LEAFNYLKDNILNLSDDSQDLTLSELTDSDLTLNFYYVGEDSPFISIFPDTDISHIVEKYVDLIV